MELQVFSVYDSKAKSYLQPFHAVNAAVAIRMITEALSDSQHLFAKYPDDYTLQQLATFDDDTGHFVALNQGPLTLGNLLTFKPVQ